MTKFIANFEFGSNMTPAQAEEWISSIHNNLPEGTVATVRTVPLVLNLEDVTPQHVGQQVSVFVNRSTGTVTGRLDAVYPAGRQSLARTLVIDGRAYTLIYGVVQISEW